MTQKISQERKRQRSNKRRSVSRDVDEVDVLSAIWIMSSNDENNLITYRGLQARLNFGSESKLRELVWSRPELFRRSAQRSHVEAWKAEMRAGKRRPRWIAELDSEKARIAEINKLTEDDVFRSQFRGERNADRSPIEIIKWGIEHLDRIRKARLEMADAAVRQWQIWLVFFVGVVGIIVQIAIAAANLELTIKTPQHTASPSARSS